MHNTLGSHISSVFEIYGVFFCVFILRIAVYVYIAMLQLPCGSLKTTSGNWFLTSTPSQIHSLFNHYCCVCL